MKAKIIKIGNSRGVRLPKTLLEQVGLLEDVKLEATNGRIVISAAHKPREGWEHAFQAMRAIGDDKLIDASCSLNSSWDGQDWEWK